VIELKRGWLFWYVTDADGKRERFWVRDKAYNRYVHLRLKRFMDKNIPKSYRLSLAIEEDGHVIYTKNTQAVRAGSRLEGVQRLDEGHKDIWKEIHWSFNHMDQVSEKTE
jgi:hypothetical protein